MSDLSIRRMTIAEEAQAAARRFIQTKDAEPNPYVGTDDEQVWRSAFERHLLALSAPEGCEGGA